MILLKRVIHDLKTNSVEATWVERSVAPDTFDADSNLVAGAITDTQVRCHSYADVQMDMLRADIATLGGDVSEHEALIALVESNIAPPVPLTTVQLDAIRAARIEALWRAADQYVASQISGVAIGLLTIGMIQGMPKALAVVGWSSSVWEAYYTRKALVATTDSDDLSFASFGPMPYGVPELRAELGM